MWYVCSSTVCYFCPAPLNLFLFLVIIRTVIVINSAKFTLYRSYMDATHHISPILESERS